MERKIVLILLLSLCFVFFGFSQQKKVAVFDPTGIDDDVVIEVAREILINSIISSADYVLLEREQISQVLKENQYQATGNVDDGQISELGKQIGAEYVCVGTVKLLGNKYFFSARLVDVVTAQAMASGQSANTDVFAALEAAAAKLVGGSKGKKNVVVVLSEMPDDKSSKEDARIAKEKEKELAIARSKQKEMEKELAELKQKQKELEAERLKIEAKEKRLAEAREKEKIEAEKRASKEAVLEAKEKERLEVAASKAKEKQDKEKLDLERKRLAEARAQEKEKAKVIKRERELAEAKDKAEAKAAEKAKAEELAVAQAKAAQVEKELAQAKAEQDKIEKELAAKEIVNQSKTAPTGLSRIFANRDASKRTISIVTGGKAYKEEVAEVVSSCKTALGSDYNIGGDYKLPFQVKPTVKKWSKYAKVDYVINFGVGAGNKIVVNIYNSNRAEFRFFYTKSKANSEVDIDELISLFKPYLDK